MIRHVIDQHQNPIPAVLEIPSKDHPYDPNKDSILRRAKVKEGEQIMAVGLREILTVEKMQIGSNWIFLIWYVTSLLPRLFLSKKSLLQTV